MNNSELVFKEFQYRAITKYLEEAPIHNEVKFNWSKKIPAGVSKLEHYQCIGYNLLENKVAPNVENLDRSILFISASFVPIILFAEGFENASTSEIVGPYIRGCWKGLTIAVNPKILSDKFFLLLEFTDAGEIFTVIQD